MGKVWGKQVVQIGWKIAQAIVKIRVTAELVSGTLDYVNFISVMKSVEGIWQKSRGMKEWAFFKVFSNKVEHGQIGGRGKFFYQGEARGGWLLQLREQWGKA